ncbi:MAG: hypothetical protein U0800_12370 [Isosphaeraceae bacterium]
MSTAGIASHVPRRISPRQQAGLILEATCAAISLILLAWLLLWFIHRKAGRPQVDALFVRADHLGVLFQERDARSLAGERKLAEIEKTPANLVASIEALVHRPGPARVLYVSAPALGLGPEDARIIGEDGEKGKGPTVLDIIRTVAEKSSGDVVLALDCAQVGSNREWGVFGNSPYFRLREALADLKPRNNLAVLLPCEPGEASLIYGGEGRSLFAAALEDVLRNRAADGPSIAVQDLYSQVRSLVAKNAQIPRAAQTPQLIAIGPNPKAVDFRVGRLPAPSGASPPSKTEPIAKSAPPAQDEPKVAGPKEQRNELVDGLMAHWKIHEGIREGKLLAGKQVEKVEAPEVVAPVAYRLYEAALERAQLLVRQALRDRLEKSIKLASKAVEDVQVPQDRLIERLRDYRSVQASFPFRPVEDTQWNEVDAIVNGLTRTQPAAGAAGNGPGGNASPLAKELDEARGKKPLGGSYPETHLELQLPLWAITYVNIFKVPEAFDSSKGRAGELLRKATEARRNAEKALAAVEFGGLEWIRGEIAEGDKVRRLVQDELFDPRLGAQDKAATELEKDLDPRINQYRRNYRRALELAQLEKQAREELSKALYDLPNLGDRRIHADRDKARANPGGAMPGDVVDALKAASDLLKGLAQAPPEKAPIDVDVRIKRLNDLLEAWRNRRDALDQASKSGEIEEQLRAPLYRLDPKTRERLLLRWAEDPIDTLDHHAGGSEANGPAPRNPGFWAEAVGLASLDGALRENFSGEEIQGEVVLGREIQDKADELCKAMAQAGQPSSPGGTEQDSEWLRRLKEIGDKTRAAAQGLRRYSDVVRRSAKRQTPTTWLLSFRPARELEDVASQSLSVAEPFRTARLHFHAERLREDFVPDPLFEDLEPYRGDFRPEFREKDGVPFASKVLDIHIVQSTDTALSAAPAPPRKAILSVRVEEEAPESAVGAFALKSKSGGDPQPAHRVLIDWPDGSRSQPLRDFELVPTNATASRAKQVVLRCTGFFRGRASYDPLGVSGKLEVEIEPNQGSLFDVKLALDETYLRNERRYNPKEIQGIQNDYSDRHGGTAGYAWFGQPFHGVVRLTKRPQTRIDTVWVQAELLKDGAPLPGWKMNDPEGRIRRQFGDGTDAERSITLEAIRASAIPDAIAPDSDLQLRITLFEEKGSKVPIQEPPSTFKIRSSKMFRYLTPRQSIGPGVDDEGKVIPRSYNVKFLRNPDDPVSEPIGPDELVVRSFVKNIKTGAIKEKLFTRKSLILPGQTSYQLHFELLPGEEPHGFRIESLGYERSEGEKEFQPFKNP